MAQTEEQRKSNVRLGWILASVALVFAVGFVVKIIWMGR
ncbi:MAG: cytochrome oxidase small assembly protein [Rubrivivax sp.]